MTRGLSVLIVEDEWLVAEYVSDVVAAAGHEVAGVASTGEAGIDLLDRFQVDVALLDIKLKGALDGIAVADEARRRGIPHLFLSGSGDPTTRARADATAPLAFLLKPVSETRLVSLLASVPVRISEM